jgi:5-methylcytosine-specific restriction endonuclease McrA
MATLPTKAKQRHSVKKQSTRQRTESPNEDFYKTKAWTSASKAFREANPICAWHGKRPQCTKYTKITDHIIALPDGGQPMNQNNWQPMCASCSAAKTNMEKINRKAAIKRKITPNGLL